MKFLLSILVLAVALVAGPGTLSAQAAPPSDKLTVNPGEPATFTVTVNGSLPMTFQWLKNGVPIQSAIANPFRIAAVVPADAGDYSAKITNSAGSTISPPATLTVTNPPVVTGITAEKK